jgi:putative transposase
MRLGRCAAMARHPRLIVPGVALHVRQRGNDRQDCFRQDNDRLVYLSMLRDFTALRQCAVHAYCFMTNHVHLLLTPQDERACALLMRDLGRCYAAYFNRRYQRTGALWEHPFRSSLVESADYVIACYRYIERNPVRACMVTTPAAYSWSSYAGNAALREDRLLTPHPEYLALGLHDTSRTRAYARLLMDADEPAFVKNMRAAIEAGYPLVGDRLKAELEKAGARFERGKSGPRAAPVPMRDADSAQLALLTK